MKEILLRKDGSINEEEIAEYSKSKGIDASYNNPDSVNHNQTLLYVAVSSDEISPDIKLKLIPYLISKDAKINHSNTTWHGGLINVALTDNNIELADLLLKEGADIMAKYKEKNLIDMALDLKNQQILQWVLENAKPLFLSLDKNEFNEYKQKVKSIFPTSNTQLFHSLKMIIHEYVDEYKNNISHKFDKLGLINGDDIALILAAKMSEKKLEAKERKKIYSNSKLFIMNRRILFLVNSKSIKLKIHLLSDIYIAIRRHP